LRQEHQLLLIEIPADEDYLHLI